MSDARGNDLSLVYAALKAYTRRTGLEPLSPGGWEVEDPAIGPPACLLDRLVSLEPQPKSYAYGKDFTRARERAAEVFQAGMRFADRPITLEQVVVLQNSSQGLLLALTALRERGVRHAVIAAPTYFATVMICRHLGLEVTLVPAADFLSGALDLPRLASAMNQDQSALIVTNPAYSVGVEYPPEQLQALFALLPEQCWVLLDETRLGLSWRSDLPWYAADYPPRAIVLRSPSKIFLLNGLKTSFLLGPAAVLRRVETLSEALVGSGAGNAEGVALAYLDAWHAWLLEHQAGHIGQMRAWKNGIIERLGLNRQAIRAPLERQGFALSEVDSGPYLLAGIPRRRLAQLDSVTIARERGVLLMTTDYFYHWSEEWLGFRLNLSGDAARSKQAIARLFTSVLRVPHTNRMQTSVRSW